ncbi:MAG: bifunctional hydroxymethylpyrimidine kinase/phosphomethylpyrimidine kinase [Atopobiaceae bacterium]|jgi:pyridoxine kinase|nr:bifunctional hydroxymethylpyrimidine kinase/phosphomethylpyrimidine kinase [Atopobiaceae bacterium]MCH4181102.1 bifunctional hydroxymethylpyrimidine kinase/phosphomethylpyrimidine kinase [Atopobiaceae bacterium]MCH4214099.1 bifunctional hydroxymethylpyrimidine kinase/phosphomethylpyrimidine kinase [Atopobiaceae bacterium]MCH4230358.1 bifunctional hydroxymethylpyrimidine kinase/phosphomethylpyrimidine kinase [Atopobiaceae bacterium]MCH4276451.1 bifunctional hydroxymethylpyrimidine kinase/phos
MTHASNLYLYKRNGSYIPRVAAVHDLCGYGKCSLGVAIPVLSAAGCDVCPVPTSLFSAHTKFPEFYMHDTTSMLSDYLDAWVKEGIELDAIYSGFLGAADQVACITRLYREHPKALRVVDPVMGDAGQMYPTYTPELCQAMSELVDGADVLTPNLTEASILTGTDYAGQDVDNAYIHTMIDKLLGMGAKNVVLKGIVRGDGKIRNYLACTEALDNGYGVNGTGIVEIDEDVLPYMLHGTGDLYCSGLLAAIMAGRSIQDATEFAGRLVIDAMKVTREQPDYEVRGVSFESVLGDVTDLLR